MSLLNDDESDSRIEDIMYPFGWVLNKKLPCCPSFAGTQGSLTA
jgi:hypothetical protein